MNEPSSTRSSRRTGRFRIRLSLTPAIGSPVHVWLPNLLAFGPPSLRYLPRVLVVTLVSFIGFPFRWYESLALRRRLKTTRLKEDPVFIIGHWRGGTTLVHNLMARDPQFGYITMLQALFPKSFMTTGFFRWFLWALMPDTRPMDNVRLNPDVPQEDELALSVMTRNSMYNGWHFPWRLMDFYRRWVEFDGISEEGKREFWKDFHRLLKRTTLNMGGRRLVLKNPAHTARVAEILKRYPRARFIHVYRNPYVVFLSTRHLYRTAIPPFNVQSYSEKKMDRDITEIYVRMMKRFFETEDLIPAGQLVHVRFEELEKNVLDEMERIYRELDIPGFDEARPLFNEHLTGLKGYRKNRFEIEPGWIEHVDRHWGFAVKRWGYTVPDRTE